MFPVSSVLKISTLTPQSTAITAEGSTYPKSTVCYRSRLLPRPAIIENPNLALNQTQFLIVHVEIGNTGKATFVEIRILSESPRNISI